MGKGKAESSFRGGKMDFAGFTGTNHGWLASELFSALCQVSADEVVWRPLLGGAG